MVRQDTALANEEQDTGLSPDETYDERAGHFSALRNQYNSSRYRLANLSVLLFPTAAILLIIGIFSESVLLSALGLLAGVGFVAVFSRQGRFDALHRRYATFALANEEARHRLRREWDAMPLRQPPTAPEASDYAIDLDILGHASLQHLLNTPTTPAGQTRLQNWLLRPADTRTIRQRQEAARELAPMLDLRDELTVFGRLSGMTQGAYERFLHWAESGFWLMRRPWLIWLARALAVLTVLAFVAQFSGLVPYPVWLPFIGVNILVTWLFGKPVERIVDQVAERQAVFQPYAGVFALVERQPFQAEILRAIQADLAADALNADEQMRRLGRIMQFGDLRLAFFFPALQAIFLWNFHTAWMLETWKRAAGKHVRAWLETLAELEAVSALGALAFDNPDWAFPEIVEGGEPVLQSRNLGHPLLPPDVCVGNDVSIGPPGTFLLVTGSNMSGKSTLLRAIGTNVVLAQAGAPVCADELRLPPLALATSMRIQDSLEYGVSYFMAELRRLKTVVDTAKAAVEGGQRTPLFLLDEILHGTNTSERQIAARYIIRYLIELGAIGAVSTHDLTLAAAPELKPLSQAVHFTERFSRGAEGATMQFDYKLRPGTATSSNALKLMEIVGLPVDETWR